MTLTAKTDERIARMLGASDSAVRLAAEVREEIAPAIDRIEAICRENTARVMTAMATVGLSDFHFGGTLGYGYDDTGRDALEKAFALVFGAESALVRVQFVSGTHALASVLLGVLHRGDLLVSAYGEPYDTMRTVIGTSGAAPAAGSLVDMGVRYREVEPTPEGRPDLDAIACAAVEARMVLVQRSRGYSWRRPLSIDDIRAIASTVAAAAPNAIVFVDNCYGEFTDVVEPTAVGAHVAAGSLIKNPGGGIAPSGGYVVGRSDLVEAAASRLTAPGLGSHMGPTLGMTRLLAQGLFLAPRITAEALAGSVFASAFLRRLGYEVSPVPDEQRNDIVLCVRLGSPERVQAFCRAVQGASPVDAGVVPVAGDMPGYSDKVIMAAGAFVQGSSIELSADAPLRSPYDVYLQGGLIRHQVEFAMLRYATWLEREEGGGLRCKSGSSGS
ncbi:MAG: aluminum resistance protein [Firmicutes bacterium ADurb.Bin506]|nr:MAG: aluminum resistance protein [Firmicutes bacterium ADurb.Bin506]